MTYQQWHCHLALNADYFEPVHRRESGWYFITLVLELILILLQPQTVKITYQAGLKW